jgi:hypothetical protein
VRCTRGRATENAKEKKENVRRKRVWCGARVAGRQAKTKERKMWVRRIPDEEDVADVHNVLTVGRKLINVYVR